MRVLVGCEHSGVVREAFRRRGHEAWSCDLLPAENGSPYHLQCNVLYVLNPSNDNTYYRGPKWDLAIFHPDCTYLTASAAWAYGDGPYHQRVKPGTLVGAARRQARAEAIAFVQALAAAPIPKIAIENPIGVLSTVWRKPDQILQPYHFGHDARKATCLWLQGLPPLKATDRIAGRLVNGVERWANQTDTGQNRLGPSDDRWKQRARTYEGIADAMAAQWGG